MEPDKIKVTAWQKILSITFTILGITLLAAILVPFANSFICTPAGQTQSASNIKQITLALLFYANEHGNKMPATLSKLIPEYIDSSDIFYIKPHPYLQTSPYYPDNKDSRLRLIDVLSPYHFIYYTDTHLVVIHETPGLWKSGNMSTSFLEQDKKGVWQGGAVIRKTPQEFEAAILSKLETSPSSKSQ